MSYLQGQDWDTVVLKKHLKIMQPLIRKLKVIQIHIMKKI